MLVLSRKQNESVVVTSADGSECLIKVTILELSDGQVRLGFEAAPAFPIHRREVWERIRAGHTTNPADDGSRCTRHVRGSIALSPFHAGSVHDRLDRTAGRKRGLGG